MRCIAFQATQQLGAIEKTASDHHGHFGHHLFGRRHDGDEGHVHAPSRQSHAHDRNHLLYQGRAN